VAAVLLAGSATDILVTSRLAYSNSLTPFFAMTGLWLLHRTVRDRSGPTLAMSGFVLGLALQTHVAAVVIWPGILAYLLLHHRMVPLRWLAVATGLGVFAVTNILVFNVMYPAATLHEIVFRSGDYGGTPSARLGSWPDRLGILLRSCALALGGLVSEYVEPDALFTVPVWVAVGLALGGFILLVRRREWLICLTLVASLFTVSLMNARVEPVIARSRHYAQLLPLWFIVMAVALVTLRDQFTRHTAPMVTSAGLLVVTAALIAASQWQLHAYVAERLDRPDKNNRALLQALDAVTREGHASERVYLDQRLSSATTNSNRRGLRDARYLLLMGNQEYDTIDVTRQPLPLGQAGTASRRLVLSQESVAFASHHYRLVPLPDEPGEGALVRAERAYSINSVLP
jgi:hypothetical protein